MPVARCHGCGDWTRRQDNKGCPECEDCYSGRLYQGCLLCGVFVAIAAALLIFLYKAFTA